MRQQQRKKPLISFSGIAHADDDSLPDYVSNIIQSGDR